MRDPSFLIRIIRSGGHIKEVSRHVSNGAAPMGYAGGNLENRRWQVVTQL
jgi:hypothetical protein